MDNNFGWDELELATKDALMKEATRRLRMITSCYGLDTQITKSWDQGVVSCSSATVHGEIANAKHKAPYDLPYGIAPATVVPVPMDTQLAEIIQEFEEEYECMVYYVLQNAHFLTMLFVSPYKDEWTAFDESEFFEGRFEALVYNFWCPSKSEIGFVKLCSVNGVLVRII